MSKTVDDRIVRMSFDTSKFQNGVKGVLDGLKSIDKSLDSPRKFGGLDGIGKSINNLISNGMSSLSRSVSGVAGDFNMLEMAGAVAMGNLTTKAVAAGASLVKSLALAPIMDGFNEYELKMNSISTILTNTSAHGTTLNDVNKALNELNEYSDKTIYNFAQMTDNIGKATAAGLELGEAVDFVKGMANTAAMFGVDATKMAGATYQMTQALASGVVKAQDWMSMEQAGMAGKILQDKLIANARAAGKEFDLAGVSFKGSLEQGWLTADIFAQTMGEIANDDTLTKKAGEVTSLTKLFGVLQEAVGSGWAQTFEQILGGKDASTKLFTGMNDAITNGLITPMTNARKTIVDTWLEMDGRNNAIQAFSNIWENLSRILGPIGQAFSKIFPKSFGETLGHITKGFLTLTESLMISEEFSGFIGDAFSVLFKTMGFGVKVIGSLLQPFKHLFTLLADVGSVVGSAITGFIRMAYALGDYIRNLQIVKDAQAAFNKGLDFIKESANKFIAAFDKAIEGIRKFFDTLGKIFNGLFNGKNDVKEVAESIEGIGGSAETAEKAVTGLQKAGDAVRTAFNKMKEAGGNLGEMFEAAKDGAINAGNGFMDFLKNAKDYIMEAGPIVRATEMISEAWKSLCKVGDEVKGMIMSIDLSPIVNTFNAVKAKLEPVVNFIKNIFNDIVDAFKSVFDELDLTGGQFVALLGGFVAGFGVFKILGKIGEVIENFLNPINSLSDNASKVLEGVLDVLDTYQNDLKANTLKKIASAVLMLSGGLLVLSQLEMSEVQAGLLGVGGLLATVSLALMGLISITSGANLKGFFGLTTAFISLSIAIMNMSVAVMLLSSLGMEKLSVGLLGVAAGLGMMVLAIGAVGTMEGKIKSGAFALILIATALNILFGAIFMFSFLDTTTMNNSLMSIGLSLGILVLACKGLDKITGNIPKTASGLILLSGALILMSTAAKKFGELDVDVLLRGLGSVTLIIGALSIFSLATEKSKMSFSMGTGLMAMANALSMLYKPVKKFGELNVGELVKGITSLGLVMGGLTLMTNKLKPKTGWALIQTSAGLMLFAQAIKIFCNVAVDLKKIDSEDMAKGLLKMALAIGVMAGAVAIVPERDLLLLSAGILTLGVSLQFMAKAIEKSGDMDFWTITKGLIAIAGALIMTEMALRIPLQNSLFKLSGGMIALALGFTAMTLPIKTLGTIDFLTLAKGLASILAVIGLLTLINMGGLATLGLIPLSGGLMLLSVALTALSVPIKIFGGIDLKTLAMGLLGLAAVLGVLGLAATLLTPVVPVLFGLGSSITLLGSGMLAASGGLVLFSGGFAIFATTVSLFGDEVLAFFGAFLEKLPEFVTNIGLAFVNLLAVIGQNAPLITTSTYQILEGILNAIIMIIPLVADAVVNLVVTIVNTITNNLDKVLAAGYNLILGLLEGINKYVGPIITKAVEILVTFAEALVNNVNVLVDAGIRLIVELINGMADGISNNSEAFGEAVNNLIFAALTAIKDLGKNFFERGADFITEMIGGIFKKKKDVKTKSTEVAEGGVVGAKTTDKQWKAAGSNFSDGVAKGIESGKSGVVTSATNVARSAANAIKRELDINSPSKVTTEFGMWSSKGLAIGIQRFGYLAERAGTKVASDAADSIQTPLNNISLLDGVNVDPVVRPVLDLSNIRKGSSNIRDMISNAAGSITSFGSLNTDLASSIGVIQNGNDNTDIVRAISKLRSDIRNLQGTTNVINGVTYDDGSNINNTISDLIRFAKVERRR